VILSHLKAGNLVAIGHGIVSQGGARFRVTATGIGVSGGVGSLPTKHSWFVTSFGNAPAACPDRRFLLMA
jgi:hypothetical protein